MSCEAKSVTASVGKDLELALCPVRGRGFCIEGCCEDDDENFSGRGEVAYVNDSLADPLHHLSVGDVGNCAIEGGLGGNRGW